MKKKDPQKYSLLDKFIIEKVNQYREPQRKGTPKGVEIGFSRKKYAAACWMLKKKPLKELAESVGVSYGLFRKWKTEKAFKEQIANFQTEFLIKLSKHLAARGEKLHDLITAYFGNSVEYMAENAPPQLTWDEFADLDSYSNELAIMIDNELINSSMDILQKSPDSYSFITKVNGAGYSPSARMGAVLEQLWEFSGRLTHYAIKENPKYLAARREGKEWSKEAHGKNILRMIGEDWKKSGAVKESNLKHAIWLIHFQSGNITPVKMGY